MTREEMNRLGWDELDVLLISGDAYLDSHIHGAAVLGRWLVEHGFRTGIVAQPDWRSPESLLPMGRPRIMAGVTAGALDSLVAHYTAFRKKRSDDAYSPGGRAGLRPNRASLAYTGLARRAFPGLPVILGGVEASMRRATHYDFWDNGLRRSALLDAKADVLLYGMAERSFLAMARLFSRDQARRRAAEAVARERPPGSAYAVSPGSEPAGAENLPSHEAIAKDPSLLVKTALAFERQMLRGGPAMIQRSAGRTMVFEPPEAPLSTGEMDRVYALPFTRKAHPSYTEPIPVEEMGKDSVVSHRGCAGGCSFCSIALHQGRSIQSRSEQSIRDEIRSLASDPAWKGSISDIGGPSANMWNASCAADRSACARHSCLFPKRCRHFRHAQNEQVAMLRDLAKIPGVKHVRIASGVRHDLALASDGYMRALAGEFTGGQLKIAPEHVTERILTLMRKPGGRGLDEFIGKFTAYSAGAGKEQYLIPYLMSAFPGTTDDDMRNLHSWLRKHRMRPQQVQCFIPTPGTVASAMFFAEVDGEGNPIPVARTDAQRLRQHRLLVPDPAPARGRPEGRFDRRSPGGERRDRPPRRVPRGKPPRGEGRGWPPRRGDSGRSPRDGRGFSGGMPGGGPPGGRKGGDRA
jgi:uncharacterized radical SAM protein YgiQ